MYIKEIIENQRRIKHISQEELAIRCHMNLSTYHNRLNNPDSFRIGELKKISRVLDIDIATILTARIKYGN